MPTTLRSTTLTLPAAPLGPENPLPQLRALPEVHHIDDAEAAALPADMRRQLGYGTLHDTLPVRRQDGYGRERRPAGFPALVLENARLRATVLPGLGGRLHSLFHKPSGRELLYVNPVLQPAAFGLAGAWFSGGTEWNSGATGHTTLTCSPLHAARLPAPDGGAMLRLWEWERLRDLPYQVDLWLPEDSDFLHVGVRVRNPHADERPVYWWSNTAVPETAGTRVLAPADEAWYFGYERRLRLVPVPEWEGTDRTYPLNSEYPGDYFYELSDGTRPWIAALDAAGHGLVQTSTDALRGRKLFHWGHGRGGQQWQRWLNGRTGAGYLEIQAGLARTQLEHLPLAAGGEIGWLEAYGPLAADPAAVHGSDWATARDAAAASLKAALPRAALDEAHAAWREHRDAEPAELLAAGSGWGALEVERGGYALPGTPFGAETLGAQQRPWVELLRTGRFPDTEAGDPPGAGPVSAEWRELLSASPPGPAALYHLGVAEWHAGDTAAAVRSWRRALAARGTAPQPWTLRNLAYAAADAPPGAGTADPDAATAGDEALGRYIAALKSAHAAGRSDPVWTALRAALTAEAVPCFLARGRPDLARTFLDRLPAGLRARGRFRLLHAQTLLAEGDAGAARAVLDAGFEVADLREGAEVLGETWYAIAERLLAGTGGITDAIRARARAEHPLPERYDYQMRPQPS